MSDAPGSVPGGHEQNPPTGVGPKSPTDMPSSYQWPGAPPPQYPPYPWVGPTVRGIPQPAYWPPAPAGYAQRPLQPPYSSRPAFRPGPAFCGITALVMLVGLVGASGSDLGVVQGIAISISLLIGLIWLIALVMATQDTQLRFDRKGWLRWATPPAIFFIAVTLMATGLPATARFDLSEPNLHQTAVQITSDTDFGPRRIGLYEFYQVRVDGPNRFFDLTLPSDSNGLCSFAYAPQNTDAFATWIRSAWDAKSIGPSWWYGCIYNQAPSD